LIVRVYHTTYGCDTGCCGHVIEVDGEERGGFQFDHPHGSDPKQWAYNLILRELGKGHADSLDWEKCEVSDD